MFPARQRCLIHPEREAAVRCGRCGRFFCRECVTEHGGAMTCAACLREVAAATRRGPLKPRLWTRPLTVALRVGMLAFGILTTWMFFHLLGQFLVAIPEEFNADRLWEAVTSASGE